MSDQTLTPATAMDVDDATRHQAGIATESENAALQHSHGGTTTRADRLDAGVPMLQGSPAERQGPEDALGPGPKRGDYSQRIGPAHYNPTQAVIGPDGLPHLIDQRAAAGWQGDSPGKGGVDTAEARALHEAGAATRALPGEHPPGYVQGERTLFTTKEDGTGIDWGNTGGQGNPVAPLAPAIPLGEGGSTEGDGGTPAAPRGRQGRAGSGVAGAISTGEGEPRTPDGTKADTNLGVGGKED